MTNKEIEFYEKCMDCRQIYWGPLDEDNINHFYKLINEYADKKFENAKCCATCRHSVEGDSDLFENCGTCKFGKFACALEAKQSKRPNGTVLLKYDNYNNYDDKCDKWEIKL